MPPLLARIFVYSSNVILAALWWFFAYRHITAYWETGEFIVLFYFMNESLMATFFLVREYPRRVSRAPLEWAAAILVVALGTFLRPSFEIASPVLFMGGTIIGALGLVMHMAGLLSLGRSFGAVPALRTIKTSGMYRFVRHPIYASFFIVAFGYILAYPTAWNIGSVVLALALEVFRMRREEAFLTASDRFYKEYKERVRWRMIPGIF